MAKILSFGSLNVDHVYHVSHMVQPGETISAKSLKFFCGGKGLNQSIALARAGAAVCHAGAVGKSDGDFLLDTLTRSGVSTEHVRMLDCPSGHAVIQVDASGQNCIMIYGGANREITEEQVECTISQFSPGDYLVLQNEISCIRDLMVAAHRQRMRIVFNPSPIDETIAALPLELCDYILLNEVEAQSLCPGAEAENMLPELRKRFPNTDIVLTLGVEGACYCSAKTGQTIRQGSYTVPVKDTTAAGDTFTGYFIAAMAAQLPPERALRLASVAAGLAVSREGAEASIPQMEEVEKLEKMWHL